MIENQTFNGVGYLAFFRFPNSAIPLQTQKGSIMSMQKLRVAASIFAIFSTICTPLYAQDVFKSSKFLKWPEDSRSFYIRTSVGMAGSISGYNNEKHAKCLENWYFSDEAKANKDIYDVMDKFPDYHPRGIIIAVLKRQCGSFEYSKQKN